MAGYNWSAGKSNNAVVAEDNGLMTASKFAAWVRSFGGRYRGCTAKDVVAIIRPSEWHHTSKFFNKTYYYDPMKMEDSDIRAKLRDCIRLRKEVNKLIKKHLKLGVVWCYAQFDHGWDRWVKLTDTFFSPSISQDFHDRLLQSFEYVKVILGK